MVIYVKKVVSACDTNEQGAALFAVLSDHFSTGKSVILDFSGVLNVTSSFVNSSFVELAEQYGTASVKQKVQLRSINRQIANMLKSRLSKQLA